MVYHGKASVVIIEACSDAGDMGQIRYTEKRHRAGRKRSTLTLSAIASVDGWILKFTCVHACEDQRSGFHSFRIAPPFPLIAPLPWRKSRNAKARRGAKRGEGGTEESRHPFLP